MIDTDLPSPDIGGKGHHLRRILASAISFLQVSAPAYGGRHPAAPTLLTFLNTAVTAVTSLLPAADTMTFTPAAKTYSRASGANQAGPTLNRAAMNQGAVVYTSATPAVATVNASTGAVTGITNGTSVITATSPAYGGYLQSVATYVATSTA